MTRMIDALLILNAGSSSLKFQVAATGTLDRLVSGAVRGIGTAMHFRASACGQPPVEEAPNGIDHDAAFGAALRFVGEHAHGCATRSCNGRGLSVVSR